MTDISSEEDTVLSLYYQGYTRKEINDKTGISTGKISGIIGKEKERLGAGAVEAIRRVGKEMHRSGNTWADMAGALATSNYCKKQSLDLEELKDSLPAIVEKLNEHGLQLSDLPVDIDDKVKQRNDLNLTVTSLEAKIKDIKEKTAQELKEAGHIKESIEKCRELTDFLTKYDLSTDAPEKLKNAILNAAALGFDGKAMAKRVSTIESLDSTIKTVKEALGTKKTELEKVEIDLEAKRVEYWRDTQAIDALKLLNENGVQSSDILAMKDLVEKEGADLPSLRSKVTLLGGLDKTIGESEKRINGLEIRKLELEPAVDMLEKRKEALETILNEHGENLDKKMQSINDAADVVVTRISKAGEDASSKIEAIGEKAEAVTRQYAKSRGVLVFEPLIRSVNDERTDASQVRDATVFAMTILSARLPPSSTNKNQLDVVIKNLKDDTSLGFFS